MNLHRFYKAQAVALFWLVGGVLPIVIIRNLAHQGMVELSILSALALLFMFTAGVAAWAMMIKIVIIYLQESQWRQQMNQDKYYKTKIMIIFYLVGGVLPGLMLTVIANNSIHQEDVGLGILAAVALLALFIAGVAAWIMMIKIVLIPAIRKLAGMIKPS